MNTDNDRQYTETLDHNPSDESYEVLIGGVREMARRLNISERSGYRGVATGELPGVKIGSRWIVPAVAFRQFLNGNWRSPVESSANQKIN